MSYVDDARNALLAEFGDTEDDWDPRLLDLYTLILLTWGVDCTSVDVHDCWAVWRNRNQPDHRNLVPFRELSDEDKAKDDPFADAVTRASKRLKTS